MHRSAWRCRKWSHGSLPGADFSRNWRECDSQVRIHVQNLLLNFCCVLFSDIFFWFSVLVTNAPLCMTLPVMVTRQLASCWSQPKLTWMQQTGAHSCSKFVTEFLLCFLFRYFLLIFCSSHQRTALHWAARNGHTAACQLLISAETDVNATDRCAFMFKICYWIFVVFCFPTFSSDFVI